MYDESFDSLKIHWKRSTLCLLDSSGFCREEKEVTLEEAGILVLTKIYGRNEFQRPLNVL